MEKFFKKIIIFILFGTLIGEIISRIFVLTSDIPRREIDSFGIQKYIPNQYGFWKGGKHKWQINSNGWPGILPKSRSNLIAIIGDSYIENFMNPDSCHQAIYLKNYFPENNFYEAARSGVSFIEAFEITKQIDTLTPIYQLIYIQDSDFKESILNIQKLNDITQLDLVEKKIVYGEIKSPGSKRILYEVKFLYYLYQKFITNFSRKSNKTGKQEKKLNNNLKYKFYTELLKYTKDNYKIDNKILVFHPNSDSLIIAEAKRLGFNALLLDSTGDKTWTFDYDAHWSCYGHEKAAKQVASFLVDLNNK